jgi:hypothetical protein
MHDDDIDEGPSGEDLEKFGDETVRCRECGADVWDEAEMCPKCGAAMERGEVTLKPWVKWTAIALLVLIALWVVTLVWK